MHELSGQWSGHKMWVYYLLSHDYVLDCAIIVYSTKKATPVIGANIYTVVSIGYTIIMAPLIYYFGNKISCS